MNKTGTLGKTLAAHLEMTETGFSKGLKLQTFREKTIEKIAQYFGLTIQDFILKDDSKIRELEQRLKEAEELLKEKETLISYLLKQQMNAKPDGITHETKQRMKK